MDLKEIEGGQAIFIQISPQQLSSLIDEAVNQALLKKQDEPGYNSHERLTRKEIKEQYKVSYPTIHTLMKNGRLPFFKIGRKTMFIRIDCEQCFSKVR